MPPSHWLDQAWCAPFVCSGTRLCALQFRLLWDWKCCRAEYCEASRVHAHPRLPFLILGSYFAIDRMKPCFKCVNLQKKDCFHIECAVLTILRTSLWESRGSTGLSKCLPCFWLSSLFLLFGAAWFISKLKESFPCLVLTAVGCFVNWSSVSAAFEVGVHKPSGWSKFIDAYSSPRIPKTASQL